MADVRRPESFSTPVPGHFGSADFDDSIFEQVAKPEEVALDPEDDVEDEPPAQREGLPPGFRMRHDAHYVEELVARNGGSRMADAPQAADAVQRRGEGRPATEVKTSVSQASAEIGRSLEAIAACLHLLPNSGRPVAERVALELISSEVTRATWLVQALAVLDSESPVAQASVPFAPIARRVASALSPGWSRAASTIAIEAPPEDVHVRGDESLLTIAVAGMVTAQQAVAERVESAAIRLAFRHDADRVFVEVVQDAVRVPASWRASFLDFSWTERPGGMRATVGLAAAQRVGVLHGGTLALEETDHGGTRLVLKLPRHAAGRK